MFSFFSFLFHKKKKRKKNLSLFYHLVVCFRWLRFVAVQSFFYFLIIMSCHSLLSFMTFNALPSFSSLMCFLNYLSFACIFLSFLKFSPSLSFSCRFCLVGVICPFLINFFDLALVSYFPVVFSFHSHPSFAVVFRKVQFFTVNTLHRTKS